MWAGKGWSVGRTKLFIPAIVVRTSEKNVVFKRPCQLISTSSLSPSSQKSLNMIIGKCCVYRLTCNQISLNLLAQNNLLSSVIVLSVDGAWLGNSYWDQPVMQLQLDSGRGWNHQKWTRCPRWPPRPQVWSPGACPSGTGGRASFCHSIVQSSQRPIQIHPKNEVACEYKGERNRGKPSLERSFYRGTQPPGSLSANLPRE